MSQDNIRLIIIGVFVLIGLGALYFFFGDKQTTAEPVSISGEIDFNGIRPEDANDSSKGKITILARSRDGGGDFQDTGVEVPFEDKAIWEWDEAEQGIIYEIVAEVHYDDIHIKRTDQATVTAPAEGIILAFHITNDDIPNEITNNTQSGDTATITGTININGYIPSGSVVNVYGRQAGTKDEFVEALSGVPANARMNLQYTEAVKGETYEYQAELYDSNDNFIGQSNYHTVTAPASNEIININSTASAPTQKATIKGNIKLNGQLQQDSTVLLLQRASGDSDYKVVNRYPANRSIDFEWKDAQTGIHYDITAALQVNEQNTASGNVRTVTAPASGVELRIDTNFNLNAPSNPPKYSCGNPDSTNHFNVEISFDQKDEAKKYHLEVGTSAGSNNTFNESLDPGKAATVYIPADSPHFARYAFTACTDCQINDTSNWSGWSPTLGFKCPN